MEDILHRVGIQAPKAEVYDAIATPTGVAGWWTRQTTGDTKVGGTLTTTFVDEHGQEIGEFQLELVQLDPDARVTWRVLEGPDEWIDTHIEFALSAADGGYTIVNFTHRGWAEPVEFMSHCSTKWATFLLSLKGLVESNSGRPAPDDVRIGDWH